MSGRRTQLIVVLLLTTIALLATGCFGGGGSSQTTTLNTLPLVSGSGGAGGSQGTLSQSQPLTAGQGLPSDFTNALAKRPIVVLFYVSGNADDKSVYDAVTRLKSSFSQYAFLLYDYKNPSAYGTLAQFLHVDYSPYLVLIDSSAVPRTVLKGFVDEGTLNQSLVNLGR